MANNRFTSEQIRAMLATPQVGTFYDRKMAQWFTTATQIIRQYLDDLDKKFETDIKLGEFVEQAIHDLEMKGDEDAVAVIQKMCDIANGTASCGHSCANCQIKNCTNKSEEKEDAKEDRN